MFRRWPPATDLSPRYTPRAVSLSRNTCNDRPVHRRGGVFGVEYEDTTRCESVCGSQILDRRIEIIERADQGNISEVLRQSVDALGLASRRRHHEEPSGRGRSAQTSEPSTMKHARETRTTSAHTSGP